MSARHVDRIWLLGGVLLIALLTIASWFLLISPTYAEAGQLHDEAGDTQTQLTQLRKRNGELEEQKARLPEYRKKLETYQAALTSDSGVPDFLRELQRSGDTMNVTVSGLTVADPAPVAGAGDVGALPITLTASGSPADLSTFLKRLQNTQPRALLIDSASVTSSGSSNDGSSTTVTATLNLTLKAFVTSSKGGATPAPTK
ncbi:Tfp pilus assembly protein PilO [Krasilnikovia cinnamomea]|uniref:Tfp pilus assembly protein PilO n=1 Tax=Krasilnikovia cinnamomea TaxID=349313 RepID=A0A4Q7ZNH4_9ACTN|nr:type 4a pilus biogenesis protein PilO [Krasilnikovia cinnamomea]RZU52241.1 Tfp pilus assembly protein PilO [Krasilnikovia cinnamomea]